MSIRTIKTFDENTARLHYMRDLLVIAHDANLFINAKGYYQKLIDNMYEAGYYRCNESLIPELRES